MLGPMTRLRIRALTVVLGLSLVGLTALGAGCASEDAAGDVASLGGESGAEDGAAQAQSPEDTEQALLEYAKCMRDNGVADFPDPTVDEEGNVEMFGGGSPADYFNDPEFSAAQQACDHLREGITMGGGRGGPQDNPEIQDAMLEFTECLRGEGLDVGDLGAGGPPAGGGAPPAGGFSGDPADMFASILGLDPNDPAVQAALDKCQPLLEGAFGQLQEGQ